MQRRKKKYIRFKFIKETVKASEDLRRGNDDYV